MESVDIKEFKMSVKILSLSKCNKALRMFQRVSGHSLRRIV
jgi:hypothetical protein